MSTVIIVGRKNVGKSTIFNRLIGMKLSIVYKEPGVTRDRIYGEVSWCGSVFNIIDTGGFFPDEADSLANEITKQIEYGMEQADLIYFVVDGKDGLKPGDEEICQHIRKTNKKVFLLINKIDSKKSEIKAIEFSKFGFNDVFCVSAEAGIGFDDVLDETLKILPEPEQIKKDRILKILILGRPNSGKSTLLNTITKSERAIVDEKPGTTRDLVNANFTFEDKKMEIIDTCGLRRPSRIEESIEFYSMIRATKVIKLADVVILIFDTTQGVVDQDRRIASLILSKAKGFVIAPNKIDLIKKDSQRIIPSTYRSFTSLEFVPVVPISAKLNTGIKTLLNHVLYVNAENNKVADKNVLMNLAKNLQAPAGGELLNLKQTGIKPPIFRATLTISVKDSYIRFIRNSIRHYFGYKGVPILIKTNVVKRRHFK
jgi:GTP-binding protein